MHGADIKFVIYLGPGNCVLGYEIEAELTKVELVLRGVEYGKGEVKANEWFYIVVLEGLLFVNRSGNVGSIGNFKSLL